MVSEFFELYGSTITKGADTVPSVTEEPGRAIQIICLDNSELIASVKFSDEATDLSSQPHRMVENTNVKVRVLIIPDLATPKFSLCIVQGLYVKDPTSFYLRSKLPFVYDLHL